MTRNLPHQYLERDKCTTNFYNFFSFDNRVFKHFLSANIFNQQCFDNFVHFLSLSLYLYIYLYLTLCFFLFFSNFQHSWRRSIISIYYLFNIYDEIMNCDTVVMYIYFVTSQCVCEVIVVLKKLWRYKKNKDKKTCFGLQNKTWWLSRVSLYQHYFL